MTTILSATNRLRSMTRQVTDKYASLMDAKGYPVRVVYLEDIPAESITDAIYRKGENAMRTYGHSIFEGSDKIVIISPEYNGSIPASLKNAIDLLGPEWKHRPVALCTVSAGAFGGSQALVALQFILWKLGALTVPAMFPVPEVEKHFDEKGRALRPEETDKRAQAFLKELLFIIAALNKMKETNYVQLPNVLLYRITGICSCQGSKF